MRTIVLFFFCFGIFSAQADKSKIHVVTTIKPITMLAYAIVGDLKDSVEISQLIPDFADVHTYSFKPSDLKRIRQAQIIFRIDEHLESIFNPIFDSLDDNIPVISLAEEGELIKLLPITVSHAESHGHHHGNTDLHIWTSPKNMSVMASIIANKLALIDPVNKEIYQKNRHAVTQEITQKTNEINAELSKLANQSYIVFHNSWRYFQREFKLKKPVIIGLNEGYIPSVRSIYNVRQKIAESQVTCVFSTPKISTARIITLTEGYSVNHAEIDTLGSRLSLSKTSYLEWLSSMQKQVVDCLQ